MNMSEENKFILILTTCSDGCCTSQYQKEASVDCIKILNKKDLKKELLSIIKEWDRRYDDETSEDELEKKCKEKIVGCLEGGVFREPTTCGCFQTIIVKKFSDLPSSDKISIN